MKTVVFNHTSLNADFFAKAQKEDALAQLTDMAKHNKEEDPVKWAADAYVAVTAKPAEVAKPAEAADAYVAVTAKPVEAAKPADVKQV